HGRRSTGRPSRARTNRGFSGRSHPKIAASPAGDRAFFQFGVSRPSSAKRRIATRPVSGRTVHISKRLHACRQRNRGGRSPNRAWSQRKSLGTAHKEREVDSRTIADPPAV